jgi:hypothetical protein
MVLMTLKGYLDLSFWVRRRGKVRTGDGGWCCFFIDERRRFIQGL